MVFATILRSPHVDDCPEWQAHLITSHKWRKITSEHSLPLLSVSLEEKLRRVQHLYRPFEHSNTLWYTDGPVQVDVPPYTLITSSHTKADISSPSQHTTRTHLSYYQSRTSPHRTRLPLHTRCNHKRIRICQSVLRPSSVTLLWLLLTSS